MTINTHPASSGFDYSTHVDGPLDRHPNNAERRVAGLIDSDLFVVGWSAYLNTISVKNRTGVPDSVMATVRDAVRAAGVDAEIETDGVNSVVVTVDA